MKSADIKKYIDGLNIGSDEELSALKESFEKELVSDNRDLNEAIEILDTLSVELNERIELVQDEDRIAVLKRKIVLVEETGAKLGEIAKNPEKVTPSHKSVLIADDSEERIGETVRTIPVALTESDLKQAEKEKEKLSADHRESREDADKKLEKEAAELLKEKQREQKELEKEQKRQEKEQKNRDSAGSGSADNAGNAAGNSSVPGTGNPGSNAGNTASPAGTFGYSPAASSGSQMDPRLGNALVYYHNRDFDRARRELKDLSNAKDLNKKDHGTAMFFYGLMLDRGEGGNPDPDAALFWMKSSAKLQNVDALLLLGGKYAEKLPQNGMEDIQYTAKALNCFKKANKAQPGGNDTAKNKYIEICCGKPVRYRQKRTAYSYCDELAEKATDGYEKQKYLDLKDKVKQNRKINDPSKYSRRPGMFGGVRDVVAAVGSLMTIFGVIYIFMTLLNKGGSLPNFLALKTSAYEGDRVLMQPLADYLGEIIADFSEMICQSGEIRFHMNGTLFLGLFMFVAGRLLNGLEYSTERGPVTRILVEVASIATAVTIFGSIVYYVFPNGSLMYFGASVAVGLIMFALMAATAVITYFIRAKFF